MRWRNERKMRDGKGGREIGIENCNLVQKLVILPTYPSGVKGKVLICFKSQIALPIIIYVSLGKSFPFLCLNLLICKIKNYKTCTFF